MNLAHCAFARALIEWFFVRKIITGQERSQLSRDVETWEKRIATCLGKHPFETFTAANKVAQRNRTDPHKAYVSYQCAVCQKYHVGSARKTLKLHRIRYRQLRDAEELADA